MDHARSVWTGGLGGVKLRKQVTAGRFLHRQQLVLIVHGVAMVCLENGLIEERPE